MEKFTKPIQNIIDALQTHKEGMTEQSVGKLLDSMDVIISSLQEHKSNIASLFNFSKPIEVSSDFEDLKKVLLSDAWPVAVSPNAICDTSSDADKYERGRGIFDIMVSENLENKKFLDYGCGEGHVSYIAADEGPILSVGYDTVWQNWEKLDPAKPNHFMTTNLEEVKQRGPYNFVLLYDVIDHTEDDPANILKNIYDLLADGGIVHIRCHPFTSRHGTHLYKDLNKAYAHLVFTQDEINKLVGENKGIYNRGVTKPLATYKKLFDEAGFNVTEERITPKSQVEAFFKTPSIAKRIINNTGHKEFPEFQMSMDWVDFFLEKKTL